MPQQSPSLPATQSQSTTQIPTTSISAPIDLILSAMKDHSSNAEIQEESLMDLLNLAANRDNNRMTIAEAGGIILSAMNNHSTNTDIQEYGCRALLKFVENDNNEVMIAKKEGISTILSAMKRHSSNANVQDARVWLCSTLELGCE